MNKNLNKTKNLEVKKFVADANTLFAIAIQNKYSKLHVQELPFDLQLLNSSAVYKKSRMLYLKNGGKFSAKVCSTMRGLVSQDLFNNDIEYTPAESQLRWLADYGHQIGDAHDAISALLQFTEISIFHEQNHRIIWRMLPKVPTDKEYICKYLNFAESLVVTLDMALGDELQKKLSHTFENLKVIYHPSGNDGLDQKSKKEYRQYLLAILTTTYYALELLHHDDILSAVNYVLPNQKSINSKAFKRAIQLSEQFTQVTNPEWQNIYWKIGAQRLKKIQKNSKQNILQLPSDPLDLDSEFLIAEKIFNAFGL